MRSFFFSFQVAFHASSRARCESNSKGRRRHDYTEFDWANTKLAKYREQKVKVKYECFADEGIETDR